MKMEKPSDDSGVVEADRLIAFRIDTSKNPELMTEQWP